MPTTIIAEKVTNASAETSNLLPISDAWIKINPWFDWQVIFGIPFWVFVGAFLILCFIIVNAYWFFRIKKLQSVRGYVDALKNASQEDVMVWIVSTTKNLTIECLKKRDTVLSFYDPINITKWIHIARTAVLHIGGKGGVLVSEDYYRTRDIVSEMALTYNCDHFNKNQMELKTDDMHVRLIGSYDDYEAFGRKLLEVLHPNGLPMPVYQIYDPDRFKKYFPPGLTATLKGGIIVRDARNLNLGNKTPTFWEKVLPIGLILGFIVIGIVAAWMVPL